MAPYSNLLEETLEAWEYTRRGLIDEVANLPAERLDFRPVPESRSVRELVQHLLEMTFMFTAELTRPDGDFRRDGFDDFLRECSERAERVSEADALLAALESSWRAGDAGFREVGELFMLQYIRRFDGQQGTRLAWLNHAIDHEMYHRGQIVLCARLLGRVPALTRQIHG